jgi:hypothetical protein
MGDTNGTQIPRYEGNADYADLYKFTRILVHGLRKELWVLCCGLWPGAQTKIGFCHIDRNLDAAGGQMERRYLNIRRIIWRFLRALASFFGSLSLPKASLWEI